VFQVVEAPRINENRHMKGVWMSAPSTDQLYFPRK